MIDHVPARVHQEHRNLTNYFIKRTEYRNLVKQELKKP